MLTGCENKATKVGKGVYEELQKEHKILQEKFVTLEQSYKRVEQERLDFGKESEKSTLKNIDLKEGIESFVSMFDRKKEDLQSDCESLGIEFEDREGKYELLKKLFINTFEL